MSIRIVTGYTGTNHITSTDDRSKNAGLFGGDLTDVEVLDIGNRFAYSISGNIFTIASGEGIAQGVHFRIPYGSTESVTIAAGSQGMNRIDLVGVLYKKDTQTGVESIETKVIKGTATSGTPQAPAYTSGNLYQGDAEAFFTMYVVRLSGTSIADVTSFLEMISSLEDMSDDLSLAQTDITGLKNRATALETKVGTTSISGSGKSNITALLGGVNIQSIAATVTAALVALNGLISGLRTDLSGATKVATYTFTYSVAANGSTNVSKNDLGITVPSGYTLAGYIGISTGHANIVPRSWNPDASDSGASIVLRNLASTAVSSQSLAVKVLFIKNTSLA